MKRTNIWFVFCISAFFVTVLFICTPRFGRMIGTHSFPTSYRHYASIVFVQGDVYNYYANAENVLYIYHKVGKPEVILRINKSELIYENGNIMYYGRFIPVYESINGFYPGGDIDFITLLSIQSKDRVLHFWSMMSITYMSLAVSFFFFSRRKKLSFPVALQGTTTQRVYYAIGIFFYLYALARALRVALPIASWLIP